MHKLHQLTDRLNECPARFSTPLNDKRNPIPFNFVHCIEFISRQQQTIVFQLKQIFIASL